jgi:hypothetical protein
MPRKFTPFTLSRFDKMKFNIKLKTAALIVIYATAMGFLVFPDIVLKNLSIFRLVGWGLASLFATFFMLGNLHNWLDKKFFHERQKVDGFIMNEITKPCVEAQCPRAMNGILDEEKAGLMNLFFEFVPADDTERERAFSYFTDYFVTVNYSAISIVSAAVAIPLAFLVPVWATAQYLTLFFIIPILPIVFNLLRRSIRHKLVYPATAQVTRIHNKKRNELISLLPRYRSWDGTNKCEVSGCPMLEE